MMNVYLSKQLHRWCGTLIRVVVFSYIQTHLISKWGSIGG